MSDTVRKIPIKKYANQCYSDSAMIISAFPKPFGETAVGIRRFVFSNQIEQRIRCEMF